MEVTFTVEFKALVKDDGFYTLDGLKKIDNRFYRKIVTASLENLTLEEKIKLIEHNSIISELTNKLQIGYSDIFKFNN